MRTCYIAIGRGLAQALWWEYCAKERKKNGLFHEDDRMIAVDWCTASEEKYKEENQHKLLDKFKNFKNIYDIGTDEQKKMALRELVDRITIDTNDNITIELKYIEV